MTLPVLIVEDNQQQLAKIEKILLDRIQINPTIREYDMELVLSTTKPKSVIDYLQHHELNNFLAILDIDLQAELTGIELAKQLRAINDNGSICYLTGYDDYLLETVKANTAPLDFISKQLGWETVATQLRLVIDLAYDRYLKTIEQPDVNSSFYYEPIPGMVRRIKLSQVLYIQTTPKQHRLKLVCKDKTIEFQGELKAIEATNLKFWRIDRQILINSDNIERVNTKERLVYFKTSSQQEVACKISLRKLKQVKKFLHGE